MLPGIGVQIIYSGIRTNLGVGQFFHDRMDNDSHDNPPLQSFPLCAIVASEIYTTILNKENNISSAQFRNLHNLEIGAQFLDSKKVPVRYRWNAASGGWSRRCNLHLSRVDKKVRLGVL